ncbi:anthranilate phosphoribosyltransferase [bacterium]|nr:anthranilate phosphoribosyltransferase [bacterium]
MVNEFPEMLGRLVNGISLDSAEAYSLMQAVMSGGLAPSQIAAVAVALRMKGETEDEITGFVRAMRAGAIPMPGAPSGAVDTCGTGGDHLDTFNVSTAAALVAAAAGVRVAKHGNRAASSRSGSADVLEALGVNIELSPEEECASLARTGIAFLFARMHHPALKHAAPVRKEIGIRTVFNLVGPMTNPAGARTQLMGVFPGVETARVAAALRTLGAERAMVVRGLDGMDEITITAPTEVSELRAGSVTTYHITPEDLGFRPCRLDQLKGGMPRENAAIIRRVLAGEQGPHRDIVLINAGAVIYLAGLAPAHGAGIDSARTAIDSGAAAAKLDELVRVTTHVHDS